MALSRQQQRYAGRMATKRQRVAPEDRWGWGQRIAASLLVLVCAAMCFVMCCR